MTPASSWDMHKVGMLLVLSALAGAIHVIAPDHWVPASVLAWQKRWSPKRSSLLAVSLISIHVLLGALLYFLLEERFRGWDPARLFPYSLALVVVLMLLRGFRFWRIRDVQRVGNHSWWGWVAVASLLGPCESILPVFLKSASLGVGYFVPLLAFLGGSILVGLALMLLGPTLWNRPYRLVRAFEWANRHMAIVPVVAGVALGLRYLLRLG